MYGTRFNSASDVNSLTTGRSNIQMSYLKYITDNYMAMFFGRGIVGWYLPFPSAAHNTFIQMVYQMGFIGIFIFWRIYKVLKKQVLQGYRIKGISLERFILWIVCFGTFFGLDLMLKDGFFYFIIVYLLGLKYGGKEVNKI